MNGAGPAAGPAVGSAALRQGVRMPLEFSPGHSSYRVEDESLLRKTVAMFAEALERDPKVLLEVGGHASQEGQLGQNRAIAHERALAVRRWLLARKLPPERLVIRSYGTAEPTGEGTARDRRVTLRLID